jgi:hypothetical protein
MYVTEKDKINKKSVGCHQTLNNRNRRTIERQVSRYHTKIQIEYSNTLLFD